MDPSVGAVHTVFPNWPRDDPRLSTYVGPGNPRLEPGTYVWLVYQQPAGVNVTYTPADGGYSLKLTDFAAQNQLIGTFAPELDGEWWKRRYVDTQARWRLPGCRWAEISTPRRD